MLNVKLVVSGFSVVVGGGANEYEGWTNQIKRTKLYNFKTQLERSIWLILANLRKVKYGQTWLAFRWESLDPREQLD